MNKIFQKTALVNWLEIFLLFCIAGYYFVLLGNHSLVWTDEARYTEIAREMVARSNYLTPYLNGIVFLDKPILFYWLESFAIKLFGFTEWSLRFWPVIIGIFGCVSTYITGRLLFNRRTGILATVFLALFPIYYGFAHIASMDIEVSVFIACSLFAFLVAMEKLVGEGRTFFLWMAYIFAALAFLTKGLIGIVFPTMIIGLWILLLNRWKLLKEMRILSGVAIFLAITIPWFILEQNAVPGFLHYFFVTQQFSRYINAGFNSNQSFWYYLPVLLIGIFPWTCFLLQAINYNFKVILKRSNNHRSIVFFSIFVIAILIFFSIPSSKPLAYILPIFPGIALLFGFYFDHVLANKTYAKGLKFGFIAWTIIAFITAMVLFFNTYFIRLQYGNAQYYFYVLGLILFLHAVLLGFMLYYRYSFLTILINMIIAVASIILGLVVTFPNLGMHSTKPLTIRLIKQLHSTDKIMVYNNYYFDLPEYLQQNIYMVSDWKSLAQNPPKDGWESLMLIGSKLKSSDVSWMLNYEDFLKIWNSGQRIFVFTNASNISFLQNQVAHKIYFIDKYQNIFLFSNQMPLNLMSL